MKFNILNFVSLSLNSTCFLLSSITFILKFSKSFSVSLVNRKQRCLLLFISFCSSGVALIQRDCPFLSFQLFIFLSQLSPTIQKILPSIKHFLTSFSSLHVINISSLSFFTDAGKKILSGVCQYITFLYFFSKLRTLSSSISICTGFNPPAMSKFCCARITIVSTGSAICLFLFSPILVREKL